MAVALVPAMRAGRRPAAVEPELPPPGGRAAHPAVGLDARLRRRQPDRGRSSSSTSPTRGTGHPDAYAKAFILFVLPHGLLAVSIATTFEPEMARNVKRKAAPGGSSTSPSLGIRLVALFTFPPGC